MKVKKQGWINIIRHRVSNKTIVLNDIYPTEGQANVTRYQLNKNLYDYIGAIQIEWEEEV